MISGRSFQLWKLLWCVVLAVLGVLFAGCAGGPPGPARAAMKVVIVSFGSSAYAEARARDVEALLRRSVGKDISIEYVPADKLAASIDSEERAIEIGGAKYAGVVVWAKGVDEGSPELRMTVLETRNRPAMTVSIPVEIAEAGPEGGPGIGDGVDDPSSEPAGPVELENAIEPIQGVVIPPSLGPLPVGPGGWDPKKQPVELYIGGDIHKRIAKFYDDQHPGENVYTNNRSIAAIAFVEKFTLPKGFTEEKAGLQPDIFNATKRHLYEIKSSSIAEVVKGLGKAAIYRTVLREAGFKVELGPVGEPGTAGLVSAPGGYAYFTAVMPGLIVYRRTTTLPDLLPLRVLDLQHEVLQNLARVLQRSPPTPPVLLPVPLTPPAPTTTPVPLTAPRWTLWAEPLIIYPATKGPLQVISDNLSKVKDEIAAITGLTGGALIVYLIISEGSRVLFPPRNLILLP